MRLSHERLHRLETENRILRELRRLDLLEKYGPAGEQLSDEQLELLEREPGVSSAEVEAESERAQLKLSFKQPRKHPGRQELPAHLPRIEKIVACTPEQCVCGNCGKAFGNIQNRNIGRAVFVTKTADSAGSRQKRRIRRRRYNRRRVREGGEDQADAEGSPRSLNRLHKEVSGERVVRTRSEII